MERCIHIGEEERQVEKGTPRRGWMRRGAWSHIDHAGLASDMGVYEPANDALRTTWTTVMDRFFIDLMLEQVGKGGRIDGHLFSKRAWTNMTMLFNEHFQLKYNQDNLKNRHKTLRRVCRTVNDLLEQSGFTWDKAQHMVIADDHVWSSYTKAHPEARSYRTKSIPHYNDMCKVFDIATTGKPSDSTHQQDRSIILPGTEVGGVMPALQARTRSVSHDDLVDGEQGFESERIITISELDEQQLRISSSTENATVSVLSPNEGTVNMLDEMVRIDDIVSVNEKQKRIPSLTENAHNAVETPPDALDASSSNRSRTYWQPPMDNYFIELMLEQVHRGNQYDGIFRKHTWRHMLELFKAKFGHKYEMDVLKNRYRTLKRQYNAIQILLEHKGIVWDDSRKMVTADDHIWHDYIKVHPDANQYISRPVPHFNDLCVIFKGVTVAEGYSDAAHGVHRQNEVLETESDRALSFQPLSTLDVDDDRMNGTQESSHGGDDSDMHDGKKKRRLRSPSSCQNPKKPRNRLDEGTLEALSDATMAGSAHLGGANDTSDKQNKHEFIPCQHFETLQSRYDEGMANSLREMAAIVSSLSEKRTEAKSTSPEDVIHALQAIPDIDDDLILDGCDLLEDEKKARTFLSLDARLRKKWLMRKLRPTL